MHGRDLSILLELNHERIGGSIQRRICRVIFTRNTVVQPITSRRSRYFSRKLPYIFFAVFSTQFFHDLSQVILKNLGCACDAVHQEVGDSINFDTESTNRGWGGGSIPNLVCFRLTRKDGGGLLD